MGRTAAGFCIALLLAGGAVTNVRGDDTFSARTSFPSSSPEVTQALDKFQAERDKASVGGMIKGDDVKRIHNAFFESVKMDKVSAWDAAAILRKPVFTLHEEEAKLLRQQMLTIATNIAGAEATLAASLVLQLPRSSAEEDESLARTFLDSQDLSALFHSQYADSILLGVANVPKKVAAEHAKQMLGFADLLDPQATSTAVFVVDRYLNAVSVLATSEQEKDALRIKIAAFMARVLSTTNDTARLASSREQLEFALKLMTNSVAQGKFIGQPAPALNFLWVSRPKVKTLADFKGKVVILDFWATWCGPCIESFPKTRELAEVYTNSAVEIVGVTSPQGVVDWPDGRLINCKGDVAKEIKWLGDYKVERQMTWTVAVSKEPVFNPDFGIQGIPSMVIIAPDGTVRHARLSPYMPIGAMRKLIDPILKEFGLRTP